MEVAGLASEVLVLLGNLHVHVLDAAFKFRLSDASFVAGPACMHDSMEKRLVQVIIDGGWEYVCVMVNDPVPQGAKAILLLAILNCATKPAFISICC